MTTPTIAVVGAGPAGLAASIAAVDAGCAVVLVDECSLPGGQIYRQADPELNVPAVGTAQETERKHALLRRFAAVRDRIDYRPNTTAHSLFAGPELQIADEQDSERLNPDAVIVATGVSERCVPFPGWTLPGVLYAGGAQALLKAHGVTPGKRVAIAGVGVLPLAVGAQLSRAGAHVVVVALFHPLRRMVKDPMGLWAGRRVVLEGLQYTRWLRSAGVPILEGWAPVRVEGASTAKAIVLAPVDRDGHHLVERSRRFEVDAIGLNFGFTANSELVRMAGGKVFYDSTIGGWLPCRDRLGKTSLDRIYVAGDGAGLRGAFVAEAEGYMVGTAVAGELTGRSPTAMHRLEKVRSTNERFQKALRKTLELPPGVWDWANSDTTVCRCECVTRGRIDEAKSEGHCSLDALKRNTRVGMGWCGGRTCLQAAAAYIHGGGSASTLQPMRARPVARPVKLGALANPRRDQ